MHPATEPLAAGWRGNVSVNTQNGEEPESRSPCSLIAPHLVGETRAWAQHSVVPTGSNPGALTEAQGLGHLAPVNLSSHITDRSHLLTLAYPH